MNTTHPLSGAHLRTYETIFQHPISHNLEWRSVRALLEHLGEVVEASNGNLKVTRNGQTIVLHRANTKDVGSADEVMSLRHFLKKSEPVAPAAEEQETQWLLVIDHHQACIFRTGARGGTPTRILPDEHFRHTRDSGNVARGKEKPDPTSFFKPVAEALPTTGALLVFGTGTGTSSEMDQFIKWLQTHHPEVARRIVGSQVVEGNRLSNDELLAKARDFYLNLPPAAIPSADGDGSGQTSEQSIQTKAKE
jgi:hypothetical protein